MTSRPEVEHGLSPILREMINCMSCSSRRSVILASCRNCSSWALPVSVFHSLYYLSNWNGVGAAGFHWCWPYERQRLCSPPRRWCLLHRWGCGRCPSEQLRGQVIWCFVMIGVPGRIIGVVLQLPRPLVRHGRQFSLWLLSSPALCHSRGLAPRSGRCLSECHLLRSDECAIPDF